MSLLTNKSFRVFIVLAAGAGLLLYFFVEPKDGNLPKCFFHELTGLYCPGCGGQRSLHALMNGHLLTAIDHNLLFILLLPFILYFSFVFITGRKYSKSSFIYNANFSLVIAIVVVSFWILRNIPLTPFSWLAP